MLKYVVPEYGFPALYFGIANVVANGLIMLRSVHSRMHILMEDQTLTFIQLRCPLGLSEHGGRLYLQPSSLNTSAVKIRLYILLVRSMRLDGEWRLSYISTEKFKIYLEINASFEFHETTPSTLSGCGRSTIYIISLHCQGVYQAYVLVGIELLTCSWPSCTAALFPYSRAMSLGLCCPSQQDPYILH